VEITLVALAFVLVGFVFGRWFIVLVPIPIWIVPYVGRGWLGERRGEFAELFLALVILVSVLLIAAGVLLRRFITRGQRSTG
jgi:hypothetical protein